MSALKCPLMSACPHPIDSAPDGHEKALPTASGGLACRGLKGIHVINLDQVTDQPTFRVVHHPSHNQMLGKNFRRPPLV